MKRELVYLALGDSLTAGKGAPPENSFVQQYIRLTETSLGMTVKVSNAGRSGATTEQILQVIRKDGKVREAAERSAVITLTAGGNDLIQAAKKFYFNHDHRLLMSALRQYQRNMGHILDEIQRLKSGSGMYAVRVLGLYNPLPEFEEAVFWVNKFNEHLRSFQSGCIQIVNVYDDFLGKEDDYLSDDRFHPNAEGYRVIAERVHSAGFDPIEPAADV
ncbi:GDSL family lipase [Paenibacillus mesophilus]|uniref:GDSL-type esterase/lipase family protein n=1 Tax=Paenibacillus mesophilus TaxID=2582849 RepID=UPI00110E672C|nr:GDSL-type esterase/lipase family protein [Paenibacillus mesophilus]TMV50234.1 GDSL family lipase [Paenibacillus mesophilus]